MDLILLKNFMLKNKLFNWIITLSTIFMLCGCFETEQKSIQGQTMGTYYVIKYVNESSHPFGKHCVMTLIVV